MTVRVLGIENPLRVCMMKEVCGTELNYGDTNATYTCDPDAYLDLDQCIGHVCRGAIRGYYVSWVAILFALASSLYYY